MIDDDMDMEEEIEDDKEIQDWKNKKNQKKLKNKIEFYIFFINYIKNKLYI